MLAAAARLDMLHRRCPGSLDDASAESTHRESSRIASSGRRQACDAENRRVGRTIGGAAKVSTKCGLVEVTVSNGVPVGGSDDTEAGQDRLQ